MPLIILGLVVIVGIVIYGLIMYARGDDDPRPVRERYSHAFPPKESKDNEDDAESSNNNGNTLYFPLDAESEKRKRNIH